MLVRGGIEYTHYDRQTGKSLRFDCCEVRCLALWDEEVGMLRAEADLTGPFRNELGRAVLRLERRTRYEVVYRTLPEGVGGEVPAYVRFTQVSVPLRNLERVVEKTVSSVAPRMIDEPGCVGLLVLRVHDEPGIEEEPSFSEAEHEGRRPVRAYQHWCVGLWETRRRMEEANERAVRLVLEELGDLIPRGWRVKRSDYEGAFLR